MQARDQINPKLSVIITCFNYEKYLSNAIESILTQLTPEMELIIVDDGSSDNSGAVMELYKSKAKTFRIKNSGALAAALFGFEQSKGQFVYFLDADDALKPGSLTLLMRWMSPSVSKIQFKLTPIDGKGRVIGVDFPNLYNKFHSQDLIRSISKRGYYLTPPTSGNIYRRDVYQELGDLSYERAIDGIAYLLAPFLGEVISLEAALGEYRNHDNNLSSFKKLNSFQLNGYAVRFEKRIEHLKILLNERNLVSTTFSFKEVYSYSLEMRIMAAVLSNRKPSFAEAVNFSRSVSSEYSLRYQIFICTFVVLLKILPFRFSQALVRFRFDQGYHSKVRTWLKILYNKKN